MTTITMDRGALARVLSTGNAVVERSDIDVINNALLRFSRGMADLTFTDLSNWVSRQIPATCDTITATTIPSALLARSASGLEGDKLTIRLADGMAALSAGKSRLRLKTLPSDKFPNPDADFDEEAAIFDAKDIATAFQRVSYAAQRVPGKLVEGVHINAEAAGQVDFAAFDGKRVAIAFAGNSGDPLAPINLPTKACRILQALCEDSAGAQVEMRTSERMAQFRVGQWVLRSKLIDGAFAPYHKVEAEFPADVVSVDRAELARALGRLALFTDKNSLSLRIAMRPGRMNLSLANSKQGDGVEDVATDYDGDERVLGYNLALFRDAVSALDGETIHFGVGTEMQAFFRNAADPDGSSLHSLAPFILKETVNDA